MNQNFEKCMEMLLVHEGGFVDGNKIGDPGGPFFRLEKRNNQTLLFYPPVQGFLQFERKAR